MSEPTEALDRFGDRMMPLVWGKPPQDTAERTRRRVTVHLLPFLFLLYILAYLNRFNVSVAALGMRLSPDEHGLVNMIGNLGGYYGPVIIGTAKVGAASYATGLLRVASFPLASALLILLVAYARRQKIAPAANPYAKPNA